MALAEFWIEVRDRNPLFQYGVSPPDWPRIRAAELDSELMLKDGWSSFGALKGYDEKDFEFLTESERDRLTALVTQFNALAPALYDASYPRPPNQNKTRLAELTEQTRPLIRDIVLLLEQDRYFSPDALRYGKLVERELERHLPEVVVELRFFMGKDWSGDPGFYAWAFIAEEETATDEKLFALSRKVRPLIEDAMHRVAKGYYIYLSFRGVGETIAQDEDEEVSV